MRRLDLYALSKGLAKAATKLQKRVSGQSLVTATTKRLRAVAEGRDWPVLWRRRDSALEVYAAQAYVATGNEVADHVANVVQKRLTRLSETLKFESAKDPVEALHDLRVASRRLRAFVNVFEPLLDPQMERRAKRPLRRITRSLRGVRDWDVQIGLIRERHGRATADIERIALEDLAAAAAAQRKREARLARKRLRRLRISDLNFALCAILGRTVTRLPPPGAPTLRLVGQLLEPFVDAESMQRPPNDGLEHAQALHQLRIRFKKLRYALELFEPALGDAFEPLYTPVENQQELLGRHRDLVVLTEIMQARRRDLEQDDRSTLAQALATLEQQLAAERQALVTEYWQLGFDFESWRRTLRGQLGCDASPAN